VNSFTRVIRLSKNGKKPRFGRDGIDHLAYPVDQEDPMEDRRRAPRCTDIPVTIHQCVVTRMGREIWLKAAAADLSAKGVALLLDDSLDSGERIYLLATLSPDGLSPRDLSVNGVTTHCRPLESGGWRVGVLFLDQTPEEQRDLEAFLDC